MLMVSFLISIHAPRTGSDSSAGAHQERDLIFQSTLPARGATVRHLTKKLDTWHFNPRSPHGERQRWRTYFTLPIGFQSTLPARGATDVQALLSAFLCISIHAPRTGSDQRGIRRVRRCDDFNPRSPHGERRGLLLRLLQFRPFQSTLPARGATIFSSRLTNLCKISIHAPRTGSDLRRCPRASLPPNFNPRSPHGERRFTSSTSVFRHDFNPRSPHGERLAWKSNKSQHHRFQSTLPARGATRVPLRNRALGIEFQSTLPARGATSRCRHRRAAGAFQSTLPARGATFVINLL